MDNLFDIYFDAVENLEWSFALTCSLFDVDEQEMTSKLGRKCPYGLLGYLEEM